MKKKTRIKRDFVLALADYMLENRIPLSALISPPGVIVTPEPGPLVPPGLAPQGTVTSPGLDPGFGDFPAPLSPLGPSLV